MDATMAIDGSGGPVQIRPQARPTGQRSDFAAILAAEAMAHFAVEAPFQAPAAVTAQPLPPAAQGYAEARTAASAQ